MSEVIFKLALVFVSLSIWTKAYSAVDLRQVYQDALENDPIFQAATLTYLSRTENVPIARSDLLTDLTLVGSFQQVNADLRLPNSSGIHESFFQQFYGLTLSQPLFNYAAWQQLKSTNSQVKADYALFNSAAQNLIFRTAQAYFAVLEAEDTLDFTRAKKTANESFLEQATKRYESGLDAITTVYEAQAEYDQAVALEISTANDVVNQSLALQELTNHLYTDLASIKEEIPLEVPKPNDVETWVETALEQNYDIQAAKYNVDAAQENISVQRAGGSPTLDAIANYNFLDGSNLLAGFNNSPVPATVPIGTRIRSQEFSVGLLAIAPLVQGGRVSAQTRQARYDYEVSLANLEYAHRQTVVGTQQSYNNIITSINRIKADKQAIKSAQTSLESMDALFTVGTRTIVDVLVSQQILFNSQLGYVTNTYSYILATLQLKYAAGTLSIEDILQINTLLYHSPES